MKVSELKNYLKQLNEFVYGLNTFGSREFYDAVRSRIAGMLRKSQDIDGGISDDLYAFEADIIWHE